MNYQAGNNNGFPLRDQSSMFRKLVIADEPTGNLDPDTSWEIMKIFEEINARGTTIVMATHNKEIVNKIRHRVIAIDGGMITRDEYGGDYGYES